MNIEEILKQCKVEGNIIKLPDNQLDRELYLEVKKALELIGGTWKGGKTQGFVYKVDPTEYLDKLCSGDQINLKKEFQFFATPVEIADRLVELAELEPEYSILEPSAGQGALVKAIHRVHPNLQVDCFELMDLNRTFIENIDNVTLLGKDFLSETKEKLYDRIVANPPFSKNQDIDHVTEMYKCLKDGGRLVSIMSNHWRFTSGKKEKAFKEFIEGEGAQVYEIEAGAFKESGTNISACIVVLDRNNSDEIKRLLSILEKGDKKIKEKKTKITVTLSESKKAEKEFADMFNSFIYRFSNYEVFSDFLDYCLLVMKWWEPYRDFSYWENKYKDLYPQLVEMYQKLSIASDNYGEGMYDALGDLFMELVSHGRNGQYFTPDNITEMMAQLVMGTPKDGENVLDPACGSSRMLLSAAKMNRKVNLFGCDNDIICCKMSVLNLLMNSLTGEIAWMDSLTMEYHKSWFCYTRNVMGINVPIYEVIEDKDSSLLWNMQNNTFKDNEERQEVEVTNEKKETMVVNMNDELNNKRKTKRKVKDITQLTFDFFD